MGGRTPLTPSHLSRGESWGEGGVRIPAQRNKNVPQDTIKIAHHVDVGDANDTVSHAFERDCSRRVISFAAAMRIAVDLNDETFRTGREIGNIGRKDDLPLELDPDAIGPDRIPELSLRSSEVGAQLLGASSSFNVPFQRTPSPSPLPLKGERGSELRHARIPFESVQPVNA